MSTRTFIRLLILLAILVGGLWYMKQAPARRQVSGAVRSGDQVFQPLDVNAITTMTLVSGQSTVKITRAESGWEVDNLYGYPADFTKLAGFLRRLIEIKAGQVLRPGEATLDELGLSAASGSSDYLMVSLSSGESAPFVFALGALKQGRDEGRMGMAMPQGRFIQVGEGPVLLVDELFSDLSANGHDWINRELIQLRPEEMAAITVDRAAEEPFTITRSGDGTYTMSEPTAGKSVEASAALRLFQGLQWLRFDAVKDPATVNGDKELEEAEIATFSATNGIAYEFRLGRVDNESNTRALQAKATDLSGDNSNAEAIKVFNQRHGGWMYTVPALMVSQLLPEKASLLVDLQSSETDEN